MLTVDLDTRFAIYFVPDRNSALYKFGASVLGYDCYSGNEVELPPGAEPDWRNKVDAAWIYGFHATLKPPFRLRPGMTLDALERAFHDFARLQTSLGPLRLEVRSVDNFIALVASVPAPEIDALAAASVEFFEPFRAPLDEKDRKRRLAGDLSARQLQHLDRWGYPYVFDEFRFHMTLSGPLPDIERASALEWLRAAFTESVRPDTAVIDRVVMARQTSGGPFIVIHETPLCRR